METITEVSIENLFSIEMKVISTNFDHGSDWLADNNDHTKQASSSLTFTCK